MEDLKSSEQRATVEDLMYASVLEKFLELKVEMMPRCAYLIFLALLALHDFLAVQSRYSLLATGRHYSCVFSCCPSDPLSLTCIDKGSTIQGCCPLWFLIWFEGSYSVGMVLFLVLYLH